MGEQAADTLANDGATMAAVSSHPRREGQTGSSSLNLGRAVGVRPCGPAVFFRGGGMAERPPRPERLLSRRFADAPYAADLIEAGWQYVIPGCERPPADRDAHDAHDARQDEGDA